MENLPDEIALTPSEKYFLWDIDKIIRDIKCPFNDIDYAIKDFGHSLAVVLKEEQIMDRPQHQIDDIINWAQTIVLTIKSFGIECYLIGRKSLGR